MNNLNKTREVFRIAKAMYLYKMGINSASPIVLLFTFAGCPLILFKESLYDRFPVMNEKDQGAVCLSLIYTGNWIREVKRIDSFCLSINEFNFFNLI